MKITIERVNQSKDNDREADSLVINDKYQLYRDGICYNIDDPRADIPTWILEIAQFLTNKD